LVRSRQNWLSRHSIASPQQSDRCGARPDSDFGRSFAGRDGALDTFEQCYGLSDPGFLEYLATLGLKSHEGQAKPAWTALVSEAAARGW